VPEEEYVCPLLAHVYDTDAEAVVVFVACVPVTSQAQLVVLKVAV
jgi:hypothetical protein